jgi:hypothetical protein
MERAKKLITFCFNSRAEVASVADFGLLLSVLENTAVCLNRCVEPRMTARTHEAVLPIHEHQGRRSKLVTGQTTKQTGNHCEAKNMSTPICLAHSSVS